MRRRKNIKEEYNKTKNYLIYNFTDSLNESGSPFDVASEDAPEDLGGVAAPSTERLTAFKESLGEA